LAQCSQYHWSIFWTRSWNSSKLWHLWKCTSLSLTLSAWHCMPFSKELNHYDSAEQRACRNQWKTWLPYNCPSLPVALTRLQPWPVGHRGWSKCNVPRWSNESPWSVSGVEIFETLREIYPMYTMWNINTGNDMLSILLLSSKCLKSLYLAF
jgi:hypothetical protein